MQKIYRFVLGLFVLLLPLVAFGGQGDFFPARRGITQEGNPFGTENQIAFNLFTDDTALSGLRGQGEVVGDYSDERDFVTARLLDGEKKYFHEVSGLPEGEKIRVQVFLHNNAEECVLENLQEAGYTEETYEWCLNYRTAKDTKVTLDWSQRENLTASISASNATPRQISDIVTLGYEGRYLTLRPTGNVKVFRWDGGAVSAPRGVDYPLTDSRITKEGTKLEFNLGDMRSSYNFITAVYFDFEVGYPSDDRVTVEKDAIPVSGATVRSGQLIAYDLSLRNNTGADLPNVSLVDDLPAEVDFFGVGGYEGQYLINGNRFAVGPFTLAAGEEVHVRILTNVKEGLTDGTEIWNAGQVLIDGVLAGVSEVFHIVGLPDVSIQKTTKDDAGNNLPNGAEVKRGQIYSYTLEMTNNTDRPHPVQLEDVLSPYLELVDSTQGIVWDVDLMPEEVVTKTFQVRVLSSAVDRTQINNYAIGYENGQPLYTSNGTYHIVKGDVDNRADITKTAWPVSGSYVHPGQGIVYILTLENRTGSDVEDVRVIDQLPSQVDYLGKYTLHPEFNITGTPFTIQAGEKIVAYLFTNVKEGVASGTIIQNVAVVQIGTAIVDSSGTEHTVKNPEEGDDEPAVLMYKTAVPESGEVVHPGDEITYTIEIQKNPNTIRSIRNLEVRDELSPYVEYVSGQASMVISELTAPVTMELTVRVRADAPEGVGESVFNIAVGKEDGIDKYTSNITEHSLGEFIDDRVQIIKSAVPGVETSLSPGSEITYTLDITNVTDQPEHGPAITFTNVEITDDLENLSLGTHKLEFVALTNPEDVTDTVYLEDLKKVVTTIPSFAPGETMTRSFRVRVKEEQTGAISNQATGTADNGGPFTSNIVTHTIPETNIPTRWGPGSLPSHRSVGRCVVKGGAWQCTQVRPYEEIGMEPWENYRDCLRFEVSTGAKTREECARDWAEAKEYDLCNYSTYSVPGSLNADQLMEDCTRGRRTMCDLDPIKYSHFTGAITKQVKNPLVNPSFAAETAAAKEEPVKYWVHLQLDRPSKRVLSGKIKIYDYTVPVESGGIWGREGISGWTWTDTEYDMTDMTPTGGKYFEHNLEISDIDALNAGGKTFDLEYEMNTSLALENDKAEDIVNTAFAVIEYRYVDDAGIEQSNGFSVIGRRSPICDFKNWSWSTSGSVAKVDIIRPFIQARGGGNVGANFTITTDPTTGQAIEKPFGTSEGTGSGTVFVNPDAGTQISGIGERELADFSGLGEYAQDKDQFFTWVTNNATVENKTENLLGLGTLPFKTTPSDSGVYIGDQELTLSGAYTPSQSQTFILSGNVTIADDFKIEGNHFVAFILRGGNLLIDEAVSELQGVWIVDGGEIKSSTNNKSNEQLRVKGGMMGNARDLLRHRIYIGSDPVTQLEPSVQVNFDIRLLEATPPKLEEFLGGQWRQ